MQRPTTQGDAVQLSLWPDEPASEDPDYLSKQLLTYIGNKRSLVGYIGAAVEHVKRRLGKTKLNILDAFAGSGAVSRYLKAHAGRLVSNDFEDYAAVTARCYLANRSGVDLGRVAEYATRLNRDVERVRLPPGIIETLYSPRDESKITAEDRVFYTRENARRLDNYRRLLADAPAPLADFLMAPLLSRASVHANTAGVFKGFYKDRETGVGRFGGSNADALTRIRGRIELDVPVFSRFECDVEVLQEDANSAVRRVRGLDLAYFDPPYNQHPYGSNYFMLNLLVKYEHPVEVSRVSGIPADWRRSGYNVRSRSAELVKDLVSHTDAPFLLVSYNDEGFVAPAEMRGLLSEAGTVRVVEAPYNTYRGSRNLSGRGIHVTEQLFLVERH